jgi:hypothetical protein
MIRWLLIAVALIGFAFAKPALACGHADNPAPATVALSADNGCEVRHGGGQPDSGHHRGTEASVCCASPVCVPLLFTAGQRPPLGTLSAPVMLVAHTDGTPLHRAPPVPPPRA